MKRRLLSLPRAAAESGIGYRVLRAAVEDGRLPRARDSDGDEIEFVGMGVADPVFIDSHDLKRFKPTYVDGRRVMAGRE